MKYTNNQIVKSFLPNRHFRHFRLGGGVAVALVALLVAGAAEASVIDDVNAAADDAADALDEIAVIIAAGPLNEQQLTDLYVDFNARHDVALGLVDDVDACGRECPYSATILQDALDDYLEAKQDVLDLWISQMAYSDEFCCTSIVGGDCVGGFPVPLLATCVGGIKASCDAPGSNPDGSIFCGDPEGWE